MGVQAFAHAIPSVWNTFPFSSSLTSSYSVFRSWKGYLLQVAFPDCYPHWDDYTLTSRQLPPMCSPGLSTNHRVG